VLSEGEWELVLHVWAK
nr:cytochrome c554 {heme-containing peptide} [Nitrosomonas europaea, Peptide Partial, 16 aa] [Nitrosomonas europaea]